MTGVGDEEDVAGLELVAAPSIAFMIASAVALRVSSFVLGSNPRPFARASIAFASGSQAARVPFHPL